MMSTFQQAIVVMAFIDMQRERADHPNGRRVATAEELDALAEPFWRWADLKGSVAAFANAIRSRWRPGSSGQSKASYPAPAEAQ